MTAHEREVEQTNDPIPETKHITREDILNAPGGCFNLMVENAGGVGSLYEYEKLEDEWWERNIK